MRCDRARVSRRFGHFPFGYGALEEIFDVVRSHGTSPKDGRERDYLSLSRWCAGVGQRWLRFSPDSAAARIRPPGPEGVKDVPLSVAANVGFPPIVDIRRLRPLSTQ